MFKLFTRKKVLLESFRLELQLCSHQLQSRFDVRARLLGPRNSGMRPFSNPLIHYVVPDGGKIESPAISIESWLQCMNKN